MKVYVKMHKKRYDDYFAELQVTRDAKRAKIKAEQ
jgi:hypothetical protein